VCQLGSVELYAITAGVTHADGLWWIITRCSAETTLIVFNGTVTLHAAWIKRVTSGFHISVALFGQKLLDSLPIIFRKPSVYNQFNHLHKESVPILSA
jgi:hypothetical protein